MVQIMNHVRYVKRNDAIGVRSATLKAADIRRLHGLQEGMDRTLTCIDERAVDRLIDREQARFRETHPESAQAWARGQIGRAHV